MEVGPYQGQVQMRRLVVDSCPVQGHSERQVEPYLRHFPGMQVLRQQAVGQMLVAERQVQAVAVLGQAKHLVVGRLDS